MFRRSSCPLAPRLAVGLAALGVWSILLGSALGAGFQDLAEFLQSPPQDLVVNAERETYDSRPSLCVAPDGSVWMAWHAYYRGQDRIMARRLGPGEPGPVHDLHGAGQAYGPPVIVASRDNSARLFAAARRPKHRRWCIVAKEAWGTDGRWAWASCDRDGDRIFPAAGAVWQNTVLLSWCSHRQGRFRVHADLLGPDTWTPLKLVSSSDGDSFRSAIAGARGRAWVFWDCYRDGHYAVWGRPVLPELGPAEPISPPGKNCLTPTALPTDSGLYVAWLEVEDVIGGEGAITQWHTLHVARRKDDGWRILRDAEGNSAAATLTHGLIARIKPEPVATGGYMGRRRHPMLLEDGDAVWLLWERKTDHRGSTPAVTGNLVGRRYASGRWHEPVVLHQGYVDYHLASPARAHGGKFLFVASELPRKGRRIYHCVKGDLNEFTEFQQDDWPGWHPVKLPFDDAEGPRREIRIGDKSYRLYWGDLHCHSGLTADAEGEPDELLHYARDRARLDVVVMTQNDHIYDSFLTEGEFALDHLLAGAFTHEGSFLVLPGYEWTSRVPRSPDVARSDPINWTYPYWRKSYPDHRTIIYPPAGGPVVRHPEVENDIQRLYDAVLEAGGLTLTQHPTWDLTGHPVEVGVEVTTGWGIYIRNPARVHQALDEGHRFGFVGSGDSHRRNPGLCGGLTAIYAEALTAEAVLDALRNRRVYATNGSRIAVESWANDRFMGQEAHSSDGKAEIRLTVVGTKPIVTATLIRDGEEIKTFEGDGTVNLSAVHHDADLSPGTHWYYWRIAQQGTSPNYPGNVKVARGHLAWSTPHWVTME